MNLGRLRAGELTALAGSTGLLILLFFDWFGLDAPGLGARPHTIALGGLSGWSTLGWLMDVLLCISIAGGFVIAYMTLRRSSPAWPVGAAVLTSFVGAAAFLVLVVRVVTLGDNAGGGAEVTVALPAYLGLVCAALIPAGAWIVLRDERTGAPESAYTPPPARPVPGT
jgi:hypothetical protein